MLILMLAAYTAVMFLIWKFLNWYIPAYGDLGWVVWMVGCFAIAFAIEARKKARERREGRQAGQIEYQD